MNELAASHRIAIVSPGAFLDTVSALCAMIELFAESGFAVDVFTHSGPDFLVPSFEHPNITVHVLHSIPSVAAGMATDGVSPGTWGRLTQVFTQKERAIRGALIKREVAGRHRRRPYTAFIGVDPEGLSLASSLVNGLNVPLVYYSLELLLSDELSSDSECSAKEEERALSRQSAFVVIQDRERAALMAADNDIPLDRFVFVPNAPLGPARRQRKDYWHRRFNLSAQTRIVLHSGSLWQWTRIEDIVAASHGLPEGWVLIVHSRSDAESLPLVDRLREMAAPGKVFFSLSPISRQEYDLLVNSADIGVAFYAPDAGSRFTQENIRTIGLASGKISHCLRAGLPVIVNSTPSIAKTAVEEGFGVAIDSAAELGKAVSSIEANYARYSDCACIFFDQNLDLRRGLAQLLARLESLVRVSESAVTTGESG